VRIILKRNKLFIFLNMNWKSNCCRRSWWKNRSIVHEILVSVRL